MSTECFLFVQKIPLSMNMVMSMIVSMPVIMVMIWQICMRRINPLHTFRALNRIQVRQIDSHSFSIASHQDLFMSATKSLPKSHSLSAQSKNSPVSGYTSPHLISFTYPSPTGAKRANLSTASQQKEENNGLTHSKAISLSALIS